MSDISTLINLSPDFVLNSLSQFYPWSFKQLMQFQKFLSWEHLSKNEKIKWNLRMIDFFRELLDFGRSGGLSMNRSVPFTLELIDEYREKWDWTYLSDNPNIPWSIQILDKYQDLWAWESYEFAGNIGLSSNIYLPWDEQLIEKFKDKWFWGELSSNPALPWSLDLIKKYESLWTFDGHYGHWGLSVNPSPKVREILQTYYPERIDKEYCKPSLVCYYEETPAEDRIINSILSVFSENIDSAEDVLSSITRRRDNH